MENLQFPKDEGQKPILETTTPQSDHHTDFNNKRLFDRLKAENVTLERLKADLLQNKQSREKLRTIAHALAALCEAPPDNHQ